MALLSAGWLVPLWLGVSSYLHFMEVEIWPRLSRQEPIVNTFPYLDFAGEAFGIAFLWLAVVIMAWAFYALRPGNHRRSGV